MCQPKYEKPYFAIDRHLFLVTGTKLYGAMA